MPLAGAFGWCLWLVPLDHLREIALSGLSYDIASCKLPCRIALCRLYWEVASCGIGLHCANRIVELHYEIASWDRIVLHRGVALCNLHYVDSNLRILYCSILRILSCGFCHTDSIVQIPSCEFHRAHSIVGLRCEIVLYRLHRGYSIVRIPSYFIVRILLCEFHCADSIVRISSWDRVVGLHRANCIVRIASCAFYPTPSCAFHRAHSIQLYRVIPSWAFHRGIASCELHRADCIVRTALCELHRANCIVRTAL